MGLTGEGAYFDELVGEAGDFNPFTDRGWGTLRRRFERVSGPRRGLRVVDVGCGTGRSVSIYQPQAAAYVGVDLSLGALGQALRNYPERSWACADALSLPLVEGGADVVGFSSVLHHVPDINGALREAVRALRPGGLVFAFDPNLLHPAMALFRHPRSPLYRTEGVSPHERPILPAVLRQSFRSAGLTRVGQRCQSDIPYRAVAPKLLNALLPFYNAIDCVWEAIGAGRIFGTFVITWGWKPAASETRPATESS